MAQWYNDFASHRAGHGSLGGAFDNQTSALLALCGLVSELNDILYTAFLHNPKEPNEPDNPAVPDDPIGAPD